MEIKSISVHSIEVLKSEISKIKNDNEPWVTDIDIQIRPNKSTLFQAYYKIEISRNKKDKNQTVIVQTVFDVDFIGSIAIPSEHNNYYRFADMLKTAIDHTRAIFWTDSGESIFDEDYLKFISFEECFETIKKSAISLLN